jgi:hypothetical protein
MENFFYAPCYLTIVLALLGAEALESQGVAHVRLW